MRFMSVFILLLAAATSMVVEPAFAQETKEVRIVQQFGLSYLPLHVAVEQKLIEKHTRAAGLVDTKVILSKLGSGAAANDALLSGSVDIALGGTTVLMTIWDKTKGRGDVKAMMAFCDTPI